VPLIPLDEARRHVLERCGRLPEVSLPPVEARGLVLADDVRSEDTLPPFANTAVDGFALRAADTVAATGAAPVSLRIVDTLHAGRASSVVVGAGDAIRIMTGAPLPEGADAVVMVERTRVERADGDEAVVVEAPLSPGENVRGAGDDLRPGDVAVAAGTVIGPAQLGVLASLAVREVAVTRRARVGVLSTGDELVTDGAPLQPGQIRDSNRPALLAAVAEAGAEPVDLGRILDVEGDIEAAVARGVADCDALLSSGGVSMGDVDLVKVVLDRIGEMRWMQIAIKPAKPFAFGVVAAPDGRSVPVFGLPGNPVSSLVSFELLARPGIRQLMGHPRVDRVRVRAVAEVAFPRRPDGKTHFFRVVCRPDGAAGFLVRPAGGQGSHQLAALAAADGLAVVPDGDGVEAGGELDVLLLA
jgi:molybdenum cofactor synthesis domain-containing protein